MGDSRRRRWSHAPDDLRLQVLRGLQQKPDMTQRELASLAAEAYLHGDNLVARLNLPNMAYPAARKLEVFGQALYALLLRPYISILLYARGRIPD